MTQQEKEKQVIKNAAKVWYDDYGYNEDSNEELAFIDGAKFMAELRQPSEPTFCPDCGHRVRLQGNGIMEYLCNCRKWSSESIRQTDEELVSKEEVFKFIMYATDNSYKVSENPKNLYTYYRYAINGGIEFISFTELSAYLEGYHGSQFL